MHEAILSIPTKKAAVIAQLQKEILLLQGFRTEVVAGAAEPKLGPINEAFPNAVFPAGAVHEFICDAAEEEAPTGGFIAGLLAALMQKTGVTIWISCHRTLFPPALTNFGIEPDKIIFVDLKSEKEILWAMEEALKCNGLAAVVAEIKEISFVASRRLQLAVEQSRVTGFIVRRNPKNLTTAFVARWRITSLPSEISDMPGVGFPRWNIELLKIRNGRPGTWQAAWIGGELIPVTSIKELPVEQHRQTG